MALAGCSGSPAQQEVDGADEPTTVESTTAEPTETTATTTEQTTAEPTTVDSDGDGLSDAREEELGTDPEEADTDGDGLEDGPEVNEYGTDPTKADTDEDGLDDGEEIEEYGTNATKADTDGDGLDDGEEVNNDALDGADPTDKDVFVEVDYTSGNDVDPSDLEKMVSRFANAPVSNPDGEQGIDLHVVVDGEVSVDSPTTPRTLSSTVNDQADYRDDGYHYALVVDDPRLDGDDVGGFGGVGEFVVEHTDDDAAFQSVFMHEFGHSLGLGSAVAVALYEGIDSETVPYEQYPSVMNYNAPPETITYSDGTNSGRDNDDWKTVAIRMSCAAEGNDLCQKSA